MLGRTWQAPGLGAWISRGMPAALRQASLLAVGPTPCRSRRRGRRGRGRRGRRTIRRLGCGMGWRGRCRVRQRRLPARREQPHAHDREKYLPCQRAPLAAALLMSFRIPVTVEPALIGCLCLNRGGHNYSSNTPRPKTCLDFGPRFDRRLSRALLNVGDGPGDLQATCWSSSWLTAIAFPAKQACSSPSAGALPGQLVTVVLGVRLDCGPSENRWHG
jgi:hypothetical protein